MAEIKHNVFGSSTGKRPEPEKQMADVDLRSLIELGCIKEEVDVGGMKFVLRTLNASERLGLIDMMGDVTAATVQRIFEFNVYILALAIESVNGKPLEDLHPDKRPDSDVVKLKRDLLMIMQSPIISKLMEFYTVITERSDGQFTAEQIKNS